MTRKDYKALAAAFLRIRKHAEEGTLSIEDGIDSLINDIEDEVCLALQHDNPAFSHQKFTDASGRKD